MIFGTCLIKACVVNTHAPTPILILNKFRIHNPHWVVYFSYKSCGEELCDLLIDGLALFLIEAAKPLGDWPSHRRDVLGALGDFPWDPWHVHGLLGEDVTVSLEEIDERAFLFVGERRPDVNALGCVGSTDWEILCVLGKLEGARYSLGSV
jgi:hypothetical protein